MIQNSSVNNIDSLLATRGPPATIPAQTKKDLNRKSIPIHQIVLKIERLARKPSDCHIVVAKQFNLRQVVVGKLSQIGCYRVGGCFTDTNVDSDTC
jgi:hypothetical protein